MAVAQSAGSGEELWPALADFLDGFQAQPRREALIDEPDALIDTLHDDGYADAYLAAVADHLARQQSWPTPEWAEKPERVLKKPRFAFSSDAGRMFLLTDSPAAFRARNIFISADALTRA
jgi:hypothetical protein